MGTYNGITGRYLFGSFNNGIHECFPLPNESGEAEEEETNQDIREDYILPH